MLCEQDKRAVEAMVRCHMELDALQNIFPQFTKDDIEDVIHSSLTHFTFVCALCDQLQRGSP